MTLKWTVPELLQYKHEGLTFQEKVSLPDMKEIDPEVRSITPVDVQGVVEYAKQSITFHLTLVGQMILPCAITLEDVEHPFHIHTSETFLLDSSAEIDEADHEVVHDVEDNIIDLKPYIAEAIIVEKPMRVVSDKAKQQPKPEGEGWELVTEEERKNQIDPRLEKLKKFFNE
ncbi:uncharacterized protein EV207_1058 [Scopulibacillus darangshiensis]|uniref:DUF177 domain-containing protein n=1 Tax=Scopulibacillus darangshiensis TaxID=442528 RepID=A0A4R2P6F8_9BACL|nr:YceD family protein [Scopulibacillus darangshiensis]TCP30480.1 uncharacterized protein EV207_1058 [Scopulibacillus darangshiensis]